MIHFGISDVLLVALAAASLALISWRHWWSLKDAPRQPELFQPAIALTLVLMIFVLGRVAVTIVADRAGITLPTADHPHEFTLEERARLTLGVYIAQSLVVVVYAWRCMNIRVTPPDRRAGVFAAIVAGAVSLLLAWPIVSAVGGAGGLIVSLLRGEQVSRIAHSTLGQLAEGSIDTWHIILGALVVFVAPVIEEVMYRGLLQQTIIRVGVRRWPAIVITSVFFALMHIDAAQPHAVVALFVLSLGLGLICERTGRLLAPIVMHMLFNSANLALGLTT